MIVRWSERALAERESQIDYVAERNPAAAARLERRVRENLSLLEDHPRMGRPGKLHGTREQWIPGTSFIAIYQIDEPNDEILITRFFHGAQRRPGWKRL